MSRLLAFGCSITYGEGLSDCLNIADNPPLTSSKYAWPSVLGKTLTRTVLNLGEGGAANKRICNKILNEKYNLSDVVVILWSSFSRTTYFTDFDGIINVQPSQLDNYKFNPPIHLKIKKTFYKRMFFDTNQNIENYNSINLAKLYLDSKGIPNYHFTWQSLPYRNCAVPSWSNVKLHYINLSGRGRAMTPNSMHIDTADDGAHPGIESQKLIAQDMERCIRGN